MKAAFWIIVLVVSAFLGFMMGYSVPPFVAAGVIGGGPNTVKAGQQLDKDAQDYYKNLLKDQ